MTTNLDIDSYEGVGEVKFGMTPKQVRITLASTYKSFKKNRDSRASDHFFEIGVFAYYGENGGVNALEFHKPANVTFHASKLFEMSFQQLHEFLSKSDTNIELDNTGLTSVYHGVGLYAPDYQEAPQKPVEGIIVFEKGYYE